MKKIWLGVIGAIVLGLSSIVLVEAGNPPNMGFCIACFIRDIAGSMGLHSAAVVQYARPEVFGIVIGAFLIANFKGELNPVSGKAPFIRFLVGITTMIGALIFLGCPVRMLLRIAGGDLNALVGLAGFAFGIWIGTFFLRAGYSLGKPEPTTRLEVSLLPVIFAGLALIAIIAPSLLIQSAKGPGAMHAGIFVSLAVGLIAGSALFYTRFCTAGGIRDAILFKNPKFLIPVASVIVTVFAGNLIFNHFSPGFASQPIAHTDGLWNFIGLAIVGLGAVLIGGCPLRQLILAGSGNSGSAITFMGMLLGGGIVHNFGLAASGKGVPVNGMYAGAASFVLLIIIGIYYTKAGKKAA